MSYDDALVLGSRPGAKLFKIDRRSKTRFGRLPFSRDELINWASGHVFGSTQSAAMGWPAKRLGDPQVLILSTMGGLRAKDGSPEALGFHTGHYELEAQCRAMARVFAKEKRMPFAVFGSDPCDGRTQGTDGMMSSLMLREVLGVLFRRQVRSLPQCRGVVGSATCDKGIPAMISALLGINREKKRDKRLPVIFVPGGVALLPREDKHAENAGLIQSVSARLAHDEVTLEHAQISGCSACGTPGGGCQFLGTAASGQVVAEAMGLSLPHSALAPSGHRIWIDLAERSALALMNLIENKTDGTKIVTQDAIENAMIVHAAFGASSNMLLHIPAYAYYAGLDIPTVSDWTEINRRVPRLVDVLPNTAKFVTIDAFLAGGVPEVMLHLRDIGLLKLDVLTVTGKTLRENLKWWEASERRKRVRERLYSKLGIDPDEVIISPENAKNAGLTGTLTFPTGNIAPEGSVVKSTAISGELCGDDGVYKCTGRVRLFVSEDEAIGAAKGTKGEALKPGDILVLAGKGPLGAGMPEIFQLTSSMKYVKALFGIPILTDARFSGVTTGPCIGHIGPEALAGGPIGKLRDNDVVSIFIDRNNLAGSINLVGEASTNENEYAKELGDKILKERSINPRYQELKPLEDDIRLWAATQNGTWKGCVFDVDRVVNAMAAFGGQGQKTHG